MDQDGLECHSTSILSRRTVVPWSAGLGISGGTVVEEGVAGVGPSEVGGLESAKNRCGKVNVKRLSGTWAGCIIPDPGAGCWHRLETTIAMGCVGEQGPTAAADSKQLRYAA